MNLEYRPFEANALPEHTSKRFPWGCLLGGCFTVLLLMLGGIAAVGWLGYSTYKGQLTKYTSETAKELPVVELSEEELQAVEERVEQFKSKIDQGETPDQIILTEQDINALISKEERFRGQVYVTIEDGQLSAEVSVPTDALPLGKGRYFNGSVTFNASLEEGVLIITAQDASVNGMSVPEDMMTEVRKENLAKDFYKDPKSAEWIRKFESLRIEGDRVILTPKPFAPEADNAPADTTQPPGEATDASKDDTQPSDTNALPNNPAEGDSTP